MKKHKAIILSMFLFLCMTSNPLFAIQTDADEAVKERPGNDAEEEEECGFFCTIGEFFEDLFS